MPQACKRRAPPCDPPAAAHMAHQCPQHLSRTWLTSARSILPYTWPTSAHSIYRALVSPVPVAHAARLLSSAGIATVCAATPPPLPGVYRRGIGRL
eukprot:350965-Chlamydomonas_euryale.AAC.4